MTASKPDAATPRAEIAAIEAEITDFLDAQGVAFTLHRHPPLFTVEDSQDLRGDLPGLHVKNMFLKDKKGGLWLVTCLEDRRIKIRDLEKALGAPKMSFAKPDVMADAIGVAPGAVTPLAALNDREAHAVTVVVDQSLVDQDPLNCHPLHNEATVALSWAGLARFFAATGHQPILVDFDALEAANPG